MIRSYEDLEVYQTSYKLYIEIYKMTINLPRYETYEMTNQLRKAALSIVLNIAEGYGKQSVADFKRFLSISIGSCNETCVILDLLKDLGYIEEGHHNKWKEQYKILGKRLYRLRENWR